MVATHFHCIVVEIPVGSEAIESRLRPPARELLPEADPYIAALIRKLQDEVREERAAKPALRVNRLKMLNLKRNTPVDDMNEADQDWPLLRDM